MENNDRYLRQVGEFQTMSDKLTDAEEQLRMASPAEREQDLTQQQPPPESPPQKQHVPPQSSSQPVKQQSRKDPRQQLFHPEPGTQMKQDAPRQQPVHERQESRPNQEPQQPREKHRVRIQQLMMDGESDLVLWTQVHRKWRLIKCQNLSCLLFQKMMI